MTVYIIQDQKQVENNGQLRSKFDFEPARKFGELESILKPSASPFDLEPVMKRLHQVLGKFTEDDYLVLTGNPCLLGLAVAVAAEYTDGNVNMLQWSGAKRCYIPVKARAIFDCPPE